MIHNSHLSSLSSIDKLNICITKEEKKIEKLSKQIQKNPNNYKLYLKRADANYNKQKYFFDTIDLFLPDYKYYNSTLLDSNTIIKDLFQAKKLKPDIDINLEMGIIKYKETNGDATSVNIKNIKQAIDYFNNYIISSDNNNKYIAYYYRALCYKRWWYNKKSNIAQITDVINKATSDLKKSIEVNPKSYKSYTVLGIIYDIYKDDTVNAHYYFNKSIAINKYNIENYINNSRTFDWTNPNSRQKIIKELLSAFINPDSKYCIELYNQLGGIYENYDYSTSINYYKHEIYVLKFLLRILSKNSKYVAIANIANQYQETLQLKSIKETIGCEYGIMLSLYPFINNTEDVLIDQKECEKDSLEYSFDNSSCKYGLNPILADARVKNFVHSKNPFLKKLYITEIKTGINKNPILVVENTTDTPLKNIWVTFNLYDENDNIIEETYASAKQINTTGSYTFKAPVVVFDNKVKRWELSNIEQKEDN